MMQITKLTAGCIVLASLAACDNANNSTEKSAETPQRQSTVETIAPDNRGAAEVIQSAQTLQAKAVELGHAWRATNEHLAAAQSHSDAGEQEQARSMALRAETTAKASIAQAESEAQAWQNRFPK